MTKRTTTARTMERVGPSNSTRPSTLTYMAKASPGMARFLNIIREAVLLLRSRTLRNKRAFRVVRRDAVGLRTSPQTNRRKA